MYGHAMILNSLTVTTEAFEAGTGWSPKPQGLCRGEVCVPAPGALLANGTVDVETAASRLNMPIVHDATHGVWSLGPASGGRALPTAVAANPTLIDRQGKPFAMSSMKGRRTIMVAWSTW